MPNAQFITLGPFFSSGSLVTSPKLYHYSAGTTTDKNIWSDRGETTTLAQPFVGDSNGVFNFFADGLYKLVIKDSSDNTLYTLDNFLIKDLSAPSLAEGSSIASASTTVLGDEVFAHITGTTNIEAFSGTIPFFWAVFDGSLTLVHSASLILQNSVNRQVTTGDVMLFLNEGSDVWRQASNPGPAKVTNIASASSIAYPAHGTFVDITGTTTITAITSASAGHSFRARFTGAGLNLTHNGTSFIMPWGRDYRVIQNEIFEFISLGSGNWAGYSLNGPKERVGTTIESGSSSTPSGFLEEDGSAVSRTTYSGLFAEISTTFGTGDGSTTFNVPDSRGRVVINVDGSANRITSASTNGANADTLGGVGGAQTHTLSTSEMPAHTHNVQIDNDDGLGAVDIGMPAGNGTVGGGFGTWATSSVGSGGAHSNTQPWIAKKKYIRF